MVAIAPAESSDVIQSYRYDRPLEAIALTVIANSTDSYRRELG